MANPESKIAKQCCDAIAIAYPNVLQRRQHSGTIVKRRGRAINLGEAGFPDLMLLHPDAFVTFMEFKTEDGELSDKQVRMIARLRALGFRVDVVRGVGDALDCMRQIQRQRAA